MTWHSLPVFVRLQGRPVILRGEGEAADAKRRLLERAGAIVVADHPDARLAVVAIAEEAEAIAAVGGLRARGVLVNAVDRPALCDFTLPAIVDRDPVLVAIGTGGVSAGLAAALRQRLEGLLPDAMGRLATMLDGARGPLRAVLPNASARRRAIAAALAEGGPLDLLASQRADDVAAAILAAGVVPRFERIVLASPDPDDLTLRQARWLAQADRVFHAADVALAILARARADAARIVSAVPPVPAPPGITVYLEMARMDAIA